MDVSKVSRAEGHSYTGAVAPHRRFAGAHIARIMHPPGQRIDAHGHDWPVLTLYRMGAYREESDGGVTALDGPSIVFQPAGAAHADEIGAHGLETLAMTFDPAWLDGDTRAALPRRTCWRIGGPLAAASRTLAEAWLGGSENEVRAATTRFLRGVCVGSEAPKPEWAERTSEAIERGEATNVIARELSLHPAWLARAYRAWRGEGMAETARRRRVERATLALRESAASLADVAADVGFADQSHMNRAFRVVLGRTPLEVRREAPLLVGLA